MQAIKDIMLAMMVKMMPVFSPPFIYSMIMLAVAGMVVLMVRNETPVQKIIRFVAWGAVFVLLFMVVLDPLVAMFKNETNSYAIKSPFAHLANYPGTNVLNRGILPFVLALVPYLIIFIAILTLFFRSAGSALGIGRFLLVMGIVFIACQIMGMWLGLNATVNFGDFNNYQFINIAFWKLGVAMVVIGAILAMTGRVARDRTILDS